MDELTHEMLYHEKGLVLDVFPCVASLCLSVRTHGTVCLQSEGFLLMLYLGFILNFRTYFYFG